LLIARRLARFETLVAKQTGAECSYSIRGSDSGAL
jgi:hypothetical protein